MPKKPKQYFEALQSEDDNSKTLTCASIDKAAAKVEAERERREQVRAIAEPREKEAALNRAIDSVDIGEMTLPDGFKESVALLQQIESEAPITKAEQLHKLARLKRVRRHVFDMQQTPSAPDSVHTQVAYMAQTENRIARVAEQL